MAAWDHVRGDIDDPCGAIADFCGVIVDGDRRAPMPIVARLAKHKTLLIIIIIIKRDWQCKAGRERSTPYQSEDPNPTTPTLERKKRKGKQ